MEGIGAEVSQKIRSAIKAKLTEIGVYVDEELPDYVMVMVANKRSKDQMDDDLQLFLGKHTALFTTWLHQVLQKLQEVTVANKGATKRKSSDDTKKKKKAKTDVDKKEPKKKIKIEPEGDGKRDESSKNKTDKDKKVVAAENNCDNLSSNHPNENLETARKKTDLSTDLEQSKETRNVKDSKQLKENLSNNIESHQKSVDEQATVGRTKSLSTSSQIEDLDDEDCINIRTDGELLDTAEEVNTEEVTKKSKENEKSASCKNSDKKRTTRQQSPITEKEKSKSEERNVDKHKKVVTTRKDSSPEEDATVADEKVVDARELLNRKKAAKQSDRGRSKDRSRSRDRSLSPPRKRRSDDRSYRDEKDVKKKSAREDDRESSNRRRDDDRNRKSTRDRDLYSSRRRESRRDVNKTETRDSRQRDSSNEPPSKRCLPERTFRNKNSDWELSYSSRVISEGRKVEIESSVKRRDVEEPPKRSGLVSRVVSRSQQSEHDVEAPVPSVVKVTPRPRRPPSQQPSSTLIMKAISEANRSLANVPPRPDSTQRTRKEPVFTRTLRQLERIPPEKIAVSITNPLALQNVEEVKEDALTPSSPKEDDVASNKSSSNNLAEVTSTEQVNSAQNENIKPDEGRAEKTEEESQFQDQEMQEPVLQLEPESDLVEAYDEPMEETGDPQFVVTLNGYDPDGLFSQSELDLGEDGECDDWLKEHADEEPLLTSTPDEVESPRPKRGNPSSPNVIMNTPAVNHSNLIEVEIVKSKTTERCKYWPACRLSDKCTYYHPSKPCKVFPACKFGDACLYIHPQCKYNALCTRKDCVFAHSPAHTPLQAAAAVPKVKTLYAASALLPCKFYPNCTNINCQFAHPSRACRFGLYCTKKDCSFDHGQVPPVDKLKWTRVPTT